MSARYMPHAGPAMRCASSSTRYPARGRAAMAPYSSPSPFRRPGIRRSVSHGRRLGALPTMSETVDLLLRGAHLLDRDGPVDVAITGDRIASVGTVTRTARE